MFGCDVHFIVAGRVLGSAQTWRQGAFQGCSKTDREEPSARACGRLGLHDIRRGKASARVCSRLYQMHQRRIRRPGGVSSTTVPFRYLASDRSEGSLHVPLFTDLANGFLVLTRYLRLADLGSNLHRGNDGVVRAGPVQRGSPPVSVDQIDNLFNGRVYVAARQDLHYRAL